MIETLVVYVAGTWALLYILKNANRQVLTPGLLLEDHFPGTSIDQNKWTTLFDNQNWWPSTSASPDNISVNNTINNRSGICRLKISENNGSGKPYIGSGFDSDVNKFHYGRVDVIARFPRADEGVVGYILLWRVGGTPPEIDFAEINGYTPDKVYFTQHYGTKNNHQRVGSHIIHDVTQFHKYTVDVTQNEIKWYVDDVLKTTQTNHSPGTEWWFSAGIWAGDCDGWGGCPTNETFPKYLDIDYVKVKRYE